jgi:DNA mismatch endonuclease, patch repair protein
VGRRKKDTVSSKLSMADIFTIRKRSEIMRGIKSKDTKPEIVLRKALHRKGLRFRLHAANLPGKPDIVLPKHRIAIQVRGCFWHGHDCIDGHTPKSRQEYWKSKLSRNKQRDSFNDALLRRNGWSVIAVWECNIQRQETLQKEIHRILRIINRKIREM